MDWRAKLENQRGAVLATELKNNANKLAKWTAAAVIAGADMIRVGYVSRAHARDNMNHTILGTQASHLLPARPAASTRLIGWNSVYVEQCRISAMLSCHGRGAPAQSREAS